MKAATRVEADSVRPSFRARVGGWFRRHPEIAIGLVSGIIASILILAFAEEATGRLLMRALSWLARVIRGIFEDLDVGLH